MWGLLAELKKTQSRSYRSGDKTPISRRKADDVGHFGGPLERKRRPSCVSPAAFLEGLAPLIRHPAMCRPGPRDARIGRSGQALGPSLAHVRIYARTACDGKTHKCFRAVVIFDDK